MTDQRACANSGVFAELYQEWRLLTDTINLAKVDLDDGNPIWKRQRDIERFFCSTPARTSQDLAAQIRYTRDAFGDEIHSVWAEPYSCILDTLEAGAMALETA
ncbi:hypothetical protein SAMN05444000_12263 [Shimia gijangensis]|uniref:Uncharacterized protein n=1 Tax=Shimia gijangensis TaxID=1470563 RepID=A0A1M6QPV2_9RHOB|nr:hypothetical protein [Shimia gijangensis]SHK22168.1 hypothetical protein SAMN05444000_12263 [Shimia gijangensis]